MKLLNNKNLPFDAIDFRIQGVLISADSAENLQVWSLWPCRRLEADVNANSSAPPSLECTYCVTIQRVPLAIPIW